ncbi:MAG: M48 family metalloprotease [Gammaproteobacteria bacterium]|nr:M48 family metalloprotease [Gammaproteobacteria bacterium]
MNHPRRLSFSLLILLSTLLCYVFSLSRAEASDFRSRAHHKAFDESTQSDVVAEIEFGQTIAARLLGGISLNDNYNLTHYVSLVGKSLARNCGRPELEFHFGVLDMEKVNAYSTPGGYIFVSLGAIKLMKDESELAAVLAHEIAHITQKHIVNEFNIKGKDDSTVSGVTRIIGGSSDSARVAFFQAVDKAMELLLEKGFKHSDELESDQVATLLLAQTGYDPSALKRFLQREIQASEQNSALRSSTHPPTTERLDALNAVLESEGLNDIELARGAKRFQQYVAR